MARYENGEETRQIILRSALKMVCEGGLETVTFGKVADDAHVSRTAVNYHFKNKSNLLEQLSTNIWEDNLSQIADMLDSARFSYLISSYIFWHDFISDEIYRRMHMEMDSRQLSDEAWLKTIYGLMQVCYGITETEEVFYARNQMAGVVLEGMMSSLSRYVAEHPDALSFEDMADQEMRFMSRLMGIPEQQIEDYLREARAAFHRIDVSRIGWNARKNG